MIFDTLCFSMYSDMSSRISDSTESNSSLASTFTSSVLPTPVEPTKMNDTGRFFGLMPTRLRRMARGHGGDGLVLSDDVLLQAGHPAAAAARIPVRWILLAGIFVHSSMMRARFSIVSTGCRLLPRAAAISCLQTADCGCAARPCAHSRCSVGSAFSDSIFSSRSRSSRSLRQRLELADVLVSAGSRRSRPRPAGRWPYPAGSGR